MNAQPQTQPIPTRPAPFELQGISEDTLIDFTPELRAEALEIISKFKHGPLYTPPSLQGSIQLPGDGGGAEWTGAAFDPYFIVLRAFHHPAYRGPAHRAKTRRYGVSIRPRWCQEYSWPANTAAD